MSGDRGGDGPPTGNTPSDDLRELIADTFREQTKEPPPAAQGGPSDVDQLANAGSGGTGQPPARDGEPPGAAGDKPPPAAGAATGEPRQPPAEGGEPPPPAADRAPAEPAGPPKAPEHWSAEDKDLFGSLSSDDDRSKFLRLNARREAGLTPRLQRAADLERGYGEVEQLFQPWQQNLRAQQREPKDIIKIWYSVERGLTDKQTQDEVIANLIHGYGADPVNIARHLNARRGFAPQSGGGDGGGQPNGGYQPNGGGQPAPVDPALAARLERLEGGERARLEAEQRDRLNAASQTYQTFADARDGAGNLLHPYLAEVESQMTMLAQLDRAQGKPTVDLQDLYDRAAWANPSTRERLLAQRNDDEARKAADERKARADAARRAGSSVTGSPGPGAAPQDLGGPERSIRDEIRAHMGDRR
ncbi:MAG TPA: hypothetical protein VGF39_03835 [Stellaceae bacterium]|jgi:hypothetical protein